MGILTGLYKTLMLTRMINDNNHKIDRIMSKISRLTKEQNTIEQEISAKLNYSKSTARYKYQQTMQGYTQGMDISTMTAAQQLAYQQAAVQAQSEMNAKISYAESYAEQQKEIYVTEKKEEETQLQQELETAQAYGKLLDEWRKGSKEETQSDIKNFTPLGSNSSYG